MPVNTTGSKVTVDVRRLDEAKYELIERIQAAATFWDSAATTYAVQAIAKPDDPKLHQTAAGYVGRMEAAHKLRDEAISLVHEFWPVSK